MIELAEPQNGPVNAETHHGILLRGDRAVYENTLFDLASRSGAGFITGTFACPLIEQLVAGDEDIGHATACEATMELVAPPEDRGLLVGHSGQCYGPPSRSFGH